MTWLEAYLRYTEQQESPEIFHRWTALAVLSAAVRRRVWLDRGYFKLYPNLYVVLVADSAVVRKTSAVAIGVKRILEKTQDPPLIIADKVTPERMLEAMERGAGSGTKVRFESSAFIYAPELTVFLNRAAHEAGIVSILTNLYDCPDRWRYETRTHGNVELTNVSLTLLGATTPYFLQYAIPNEALGTGFISRTIWVYADKPRPPIAFPSLSEDVKRLEDELIAGLDRASSLHGEMKVNPEGRAWYEGWYGTERDAILGGELGEALSRMPDHVLKVGMLLSLAEGSSMTVKREHLQDALKMLTEVRARLPKALEEVITKKESNLAVKVRNTLERRGGELSHSELLRLLWREGKAEEINKAIDTLVQAGLIEIIHKPGKKGTWYRLC